MPVKMTGAQFKAWLATEWGPNAMWEETEVLRNGELVEQDVDSDPGIYADTDTVTLVAGTIIPDQNATPSAMEYLDALKVARKWLKSQTTVTLMVDVPREHADFFAKSFESTGVNKQMAKVTGRIG